MTLEFLFYLEVCKAPQGWIRTAAAGFLLHLRIFLFPLKIEEEADIQHDAHSGRSGRGQTGHGQAGVGLDAHDVSHRQADQKGPCTMTQTVDEGAERQKRNLRQKLLQLQG